MFYRLRLLRSPYKEVYHSIGKKYNVTALFVYKLAHGHPAEKPLDLKIIDELVTVGILRPRSR